MKRERQAEDGIGAELGSRPARDAGARGPSPKDQPARSQLRAPEVPDDRDPRSVELARGWRGAPAGDAVGLLDQDSGEGGRVGGSDGRDQIRRAHASPGAMAEDHGADWCVNRVQMRVGRAVGRVEQDGPRHRWFTRQSLATTVSASSR